MPVSASEQEQLNLNKEQCIRVAIRTVIVIYKTGTKWNIEAKPNPKVCLFLQKSTGSAEDLKKHLSWIEEGIEDKSLQVLLNAVAENIF